MFIMEITIKGEEVLKVDYSGFKELGFNSKNELIFEEIKTGIRYTLLELYIKGVLK